MLHEGIYFFDQFIDASEGPAANRLLSDEAKPALHLIQPGRIGRGVVDVIAATPCQPGPNLGMLVRRVIVDDQMNIEMVRDTHVQASQEGEKLLMPMARLAFGKDGARCDIEGRKQRRRPMAHVIVGDAFHVP